jgi:uncharacterized membrane-anchored protein
MDNSTAAGDIATQRGLVGFFDVLGYKSILENNQVKEAVTVVSRILETTKKSQDANDYVGGLIQMGDAKKMRLTARDDADLEALWKEIGQTQHG